MYDIIRKEVAVVPLDARATNQRQKMRTTEYKNYDYGLLRVSIEVYILIIYSVHRSIYICTSLFLSLD